MASHASEQSSAERGAAASGGAATDQAQNAGAPSADASTEDDVALAEGATASPDALSAALDFLLLGGPAIWAIAALSVAALALILWKAWRLALMGAWSAGRARDAVALAVAGRVDEALAVVEGRSGVRSRLVAAAIAARRDMGEAAAREEVARVAKGLIARARAGLRGLELISTIAPLLGLLGTVLGMIAAFQALQEAGSRADPAALAGGIWEALLTTAAGMAVAIPASAALVWFESVIDRLRLDMEDAATRIFTSSADKPAIIRAAE
ncbi:MAG: MotA/TolQ/ExbB proton channel family protein [Pseudomonadota bacterium]